MRWTAFVCIFLFATQARADVTVGLRSDVIQGQKENLARRVLIKPKLHLGSGDFVFFAEGFGEWEDNEAQSELRRSPSRGYLQEAYVEYKQDFYFLRLGRQALRWSESWTLPSLDVWTGRRFNRFFFDPLADQLTHSTGAVLSFASDTLSWDLVDIWDLAETFYPEPFPASTSEAGNSWGARVKWVWKSFGLSALGARLPQENFYGVSLNYAFDKAVPKVEIGSRDDRLFSTWGCDLFSGNWVISPQLSRSDGDTFYLATQWRPDRHEVQVQAFRHFKSQDTYASMSYGYNLTDALTLSGFVQNYEGEQGLYRVFKDTTGGNLIGARLEFTRNFEF